MKSNPCCWLIVAIATVSMMSSCKKDKDNTADPNPNVNTVPEFYLERQASEYGQQAPEFVKIAGIDQMVIQPQDLDFSSLAPNQLWVINRGNDIQGGSTVTIFNPGKPEQKSEFRRDGNAWHFMAFPSGIAFSPTNGNFATTANIQDANRSGSTFAGPSLWSGDMDVYALPSGGNGSHLDMLHASPFSMGIAAEKDNIFWVFDGYNGHLVRYDFTQDHGPGNEDHSDGRVHRYSDVKLTRNGNFPHHMELDDNKEWLYIADGGKKRVIRVNIQTGTFANNLQLINEPLAEHKDIKGATAEVVFENNLQQPAGIEVVGNRLFITDHATGDIIVVDINNRTEIARINTGSDGITGIVYAQGSLWFANQKTNAIYKIQPR